jgi:hypothetical protein
MPAPRREPVLIDDPISNAFRDEVEAIRARLAAERFPLTTDAELRQLEVDVQAAARALLGGAR